MIKIFEEEALKISIDKRSKHLRQLVVNCLISADRGHMGSAMSLIEILRVLYDEIVVFDPKNKNLNAFNIENLIENLINYIPANFKKKNPEEFVEVNESDSESEEEEDDAEDASNSIEELNQEVVTTNFKRKKKVKLYNKKNATLLELIKDEKCEYNTKLYELTEAFTNTGFPELEGDIITFIGL